MTGDGDGMAKPSEAEGGGRRPPETGPAVIARVLKTLPHKPGVYRMIGAGGQVLYVGKARSLKKRVASYTRLSGHSNRIARMILATCAMEVITTRTESEALLLEANLIKQLKPRYNVLLRDDKAFPYILVTGDHEAPQILKHRGARRRKGDYYGPFASAGAVNRTITTLQRGFLLRTCTDAVYESRTRPCLLYQIKRCSGPCTGEISIRDYQALAAQAQDFLTGKSNQVREQLQGKMEEASARLEFERAAIYRDRLAALSHVQAAQDINPAGVEEADVFAIHQEAGQFCIQVFFFRTGQNWGNRAYFPRADKSLEAGEVLDSFLGQFYADRPAPRLILLSDEVPGGGLIAQALSARMGHKVALKVPQRGEKRALVEHAAVNAREALARRLADSAAQTRLLERLARVFGLKAPPQRIEVYDNSHIQGAHAVGAMIVAGPEGFMKAHYRKFNIRSESLTPGDDFAMMEEVLTRRLGRLVRDREKDGDAKAAPWPDLLLIDGGAGQVSRVHKVLADLGIPEGRLAVVGIAKGPDRNAGRERFFMHGAPPFELEPRDPVLYYVQNLRDEAHRFAIGSHRARRKKALTGSRLDAVPGIGPARKRALLRHFGSARAVERAGIAELRAVDGISAATAQTIFDFFRSESGQ